MDYIFWILALGSVILGWKPVSKMLGKSNMDFFSGGVFDIFVRVAHLSLKLTLSLFLGYIFFIIWVIKSIVARAANKKQNEINQSTVVNETVNNSYAESSNSSENNVNSVNVQNDQTNSENNQTSNTIPASNVSAPGKGLIKVTGILFIVFSLINILSIMAIFRTGAVSMLNIFIVLFYFFTGIAGVKFCNNVEKAKSLLVNGIIIILVNAYSIFITISRQSFSFMLLIGLILPVLFIIGVAKNIKAFNDNKAN